MDTNISRRDILLSPFASLLSTIELPRNLSVQSKPPVEIVKGNAPIIYLSSREAYYPEDPIEFIKASRFRHHRARRLIGKADQGWNKATGRFETGNSHSKEFYNIPVKTINAWTLHPNGQNRRPRDKNSGRNYDVFLQPQGKRSGNRQLRQVPVFFRTFNLSGRTEIDMVVQYWCFFGYSQSPVGAAGRSFAHQGDWEHIDISFKKGIPTRAYFFAHGGSPKIYRYNDSALRKDRSGRIIAYCANGTPAMYTLPGNHVVRIWGPFNFDDSTDRGTLWDTARKLRKLKDQPWKDFAGAWGEVGEYDFTTGPLGPYVKPRPNW